MKKNQKRIIRECWNNELEALEDDLQTGRVTYSQYLWHRKNIDQAFEDDLKDVEKYDE